MSKNINVNPGQYKVAGRERPGKDIPERSVRRTFPAAAGRQPASMAGERRRSGDYSMLRAQPLSLFDDCGDDRGQLSRIDRLRHMHVEASGDRLSPVLRPAVRG